MALDVTAKERAAGGSDDRAGYTMGHRGARKRADAAADNRTGRAIIAVAGMVIMVPIVADACIRRTGGKRHCDACGRERQNELTHDKTSSNLEHANIISVPNGLGLRMRSKFVWFSVYNP